MDCITDALKAPQGQKVSALREAPHRIMDRLDARFVETMRPKARTDDQSALCRVVEIWRNRDIQIGELSFSMLLVPAWSGWLLLPFKSFKNPAFALMAWIGPEEYWGLWGLVIALVWTNGVIYDKRIYRQVGAGVTFLALVAIALSLWMVDHSSTGIPVYSALAAAAAIFFARQRWEIGAGES